MARQTFSPQHDLTGPAIFVPPGDTAWDKEKIEAEIVQLRIDAGIEPAKARALNVVEHDRIRYNPAVVWADDSDPGREHVWVRYMLGETRYDLEAEGIRNYLDETKEPETWHLKPMSSRERAVVNRQEAAGREVEACHMAALVCLTGADNAGEVGALLENREGNVGGKPVTDQRIMDALDNLSIDLAHMIGTAARYLSRDLSPQEKKL